MTTDDSRIQRDTPIGYVQSYAARPDEVAVVLGITAGMKHATSRAAWINQGIYMTAADARALSAVLLLAADHADKVQIAASELGLEAA